MFKNPLKYQQGGSTQNAMQQLVTWLVQNTGLDEGQISQRLNQILSDDTAKQELVNNLQNMQKGDQNAAQNIIGMFVPQNAKFGGKIHDFICKHAKGGKTGCGCKQEGGNVEKHQQENGKGRGKIYTYDDTYTSGKVTSPGDTLITGSYPSKNQEMHITPTGTMWRQWDSGDMFPSKTYVNQKWYENRPTRYWLYRNLGIGPNIATGTEPLVTNMYDAKNNHRNNWVEQKETGGKVEKSQNGEKTNDTPYNGTISQGKPRSKVSQAIDNNSKARNFVKGAKQFVKSPMVKWPLAGALAYGGYRLGLTPTVQSMGEELAPHMAPYLFPFLSQMRPKFILDTMNPMKEPPKVEKPSDVFWAVPSDEKGGKVEKAQDGSILDYYSNKWSNDLARIKSGWNRFKESAPGKVLDFFMPNPNSETGMLGAAAPIGKIKVIPEGVSGTEKAAKWVAEHTSETPHIADLPPRQIDETQGAKIVNGLREWLYGKWYNGR